MRRNSPAFILSALVFLSLFAVAAFAGASYFEKIKEKKTLVIGLNASYPPFTLWTEKGPEGFDVELAKDMARVLGLDPEKDLKFVPVKPDDAAGALVSGKIDIAIAGLSPTPSRLSKVGFSIPYITVSKAALLQRAKIPRVIIGEKLRLMPVSSYNDLFKLEPLVIGVKEKTVTFKTARKAFKGSKVVGFADTDALGKAFLKGEIDAIIHEDPFVRYFIAANKSKSRSFVALSEPVSAEGLCVAYRYGDADFARFVDGYIRYLKESGAILKWKAKYFDKAKWTGGGK